MTDKTSKNYRQTTGGRLWKRTEAIEWLARTKPGTVEHENALDYLAFAHLEMRSYFCQSSHMHDLFIEQQKQSKRGAAHKPAAPPASA
jgi:hypothetical protein